MPTSPFRRTLLAVAVLGAALVVPAVGHAQIRTADPAVHGIPLSAFPRLVKLSKHVYGYEEIRQPGFSVASHATDLHVGKSYNGIAERRT